MTHDLDTPFPLGAEQIAFFRANGFIQLRQVLPRETLAHYGREITRLTLELNTQTLPLEAPENGQELPELDLADAQQTVDQSVWLALLAPKNVDPGLVRPAIACQTLAIGIYPALRSEGKRLEPQVAEPEPVADPGLIFEIAAPDPNATEQPKPARYKRLDIEYAENVLERPGIVQVTLPAAADMTLWEFDPNEEGTGDYPPRLEDRKLAARVVTWLRIRLANKEQTDTYHQARLAWVGINVTQVIQEIGRAHV